MIDRPASEPGPAATVVLVHGTMDRSSSFGRVMARLPDLHVVTYDRRGYGRSAAAGPGTDVDGHVADLLAVIGDRPVVVVGHSLGGNLGLAAAGRRPDLVRSVGVYEAPLPWLPEWPEGTAGGEAAAGGVDPTDAAERFMRRLVGDERWQRLPAATRDQRRAEGPTLVAEMQSSRAGAPYDPAAITVPVVVARGSESAAHHRLSAAWLAEHLPRTESMVVDGAGHGGHTSHPAAFEQLVRRVVERAGPPPAR